MNFEEINAKLSRAEANQSLFKKQKKELQTEIKELNLRSKAIEKSIAFIQKIALDTQQNIQIHISDIVQLAIDSCFPEKYKFKFVFTPKRGKTEVDLALVDIATGQESSPIDSNGGGIVDLISVGLRLAAWTLSNSRNLLVLDEPIKNLSVNFKPKMVQILKDLSTKLGIQCIIITHDSSLVEIANKVFEVSLEGNVSKIKEKEVLS